MSSIVSHSMSCLSLISKFLFFVSAFSMCHFVIGSPGSGATKFCSIQRSPSLPSASNPNFMTSRRQKRTWSSETSKTANSSRHFNSCSVRCRILFRVIVHDLSRAIHPHLHRPRVPSSIDYRRDHLVPIITGTRLQNTNRTVGKALDRNLVGACSPGDSSLDCRFLCSGNCRCLNG